MIVTDVRINKYSPKENGVCAECTVTLNDELCIHKVLVVSGKRGEFIAFPNSGSAEMCGNQKKYKDIVHPISTILTEHIKSEVLTAYHNYN